MLLTLWSCFLHFFQRKFISSPSSLCLLKKVFFIPIIWLRFLFELFLDTKATNKYFSCETNIPSSSGRFQQFPHFIFPTHFISRGCHIWFLSQVLSVTTPLWDTRVQGQYIFFKCSGNTFYNLETNSGIIWGVIRKKMSVNTVWKTFKDNIANCWHFVAQGDLRRFY